MISIIEKKSLFITIVVFLLFFTIGILVYDDYGLSTDEPTERYTGFVNLKYIISKLFGSESLTGKLARYPDLESYNDNEYGMIIQMPVVLLEYLTKFSLDSRTVYKIRHLWVFLNFYTATFCFFLLIKKRFENWLLAIIGSIFLILSPRIFADAFYNIKDLMFFAWFIISLFFCFQFFTSPTLLNSLFLSIVISISANIRVIGFIILIFSILYIIFMFIRKEISKSRLLELMGIQIFVSCFLWVLFMPMAWTNPIGFLKSLLLQVSHFYNIVDELYLGKMVASNNLPWHYIFVWLGVTTPLFYIFLFLIGIISSILSVIKENDNFSNRFFDFSVLLSFLLPVVIIIVLHSNLYNGWRHVYFIYGPFLYIAIFGLASIIKIGNKMLNWIMVISTVVSCFLTTSWMIRNHPYEMMYFNALVRDNAANLFSKDYWYLSELDCLQFILNADENEKIIVWGDTADLHRDIDYLKLSDRNRISPQYYGYGGQPASYYVFNYTNTIGNEKKIPYFQPVYNVWVDDIKLATVFQRTSDQDLWGSKIIRSIESDTNSDLVQNIYDGNFSSEWHSIVSENKKVSIDLTFVSEVRINGLTFYTGNDGEGFPRRLSLFSSENGIHWKPVKIIYDGKSDYVFEEIDTKYFRIQNADSNTNNSWTVGELLFHQ